MQDKNLYLASTLTATETSISMDLQAAKSLTVQATWDVNAPASKTFPPGTLEVQTLTFPAPASAANGDYVVVEDISATTWAVALTKGEYAVQELTFLAKASCVSRDFVVLYDASGNAWAAAVDLTGSDADPSAQKWSDVASARKVKVNISAATTAASVAAAFETALNALTGFTAAFTTDDTAADGTMLVTCDAVGAVTAAEYWKSTAGSSLGSSPLATSIVVAEDTAGYSPTEPTGAIWTAVAAANKDSVDVTGLADAAAVAAAVELALNALTGFTDVITTDDTAADGTMTLTQVEPGAVTNPVVKSTADAGAGSITGVQTTGGVAGVNLGSNTAYSAAHGMYTGLLGRLTTGTTLPAGLSLATDYYLIKVNANEYKFATTLENALAGTAVNITNRGTGTHTFTPTALSASTKLQKSNDGTNWVDVHDDEVLGGANSQTISADGAVFWIIPDAGWRYVRQSVTLAAGQLTMTTAAVAK
jgi:hypothetical protein